MESLRRIWQFSTNKIKSSESVSKQPTLPISQLNSPLRQKLGTLEQIKINSVSKRKAQTYLKMLTVKSSDNICFLTCILPDYLVHEHFKEF